MDCLPFNSIEHDRVYKAEDWAWFFAMFLATGVFPKPSDGLQVVAFDKMEIRINMGYALINGTGFRNPKSYSITLSMAEGALNRIDRVVVRWDLTLRDVYLTVLKGIPSAKPEAPAVTRNTEIWELALADVYVAKGVTRIQTRDITDQRFNSAVCGIVKGTIEEIDASVLTKQFDDFFDTYSKAVLTEFDAYKQNMQECFDTYSQNVVKEFGIYKQSMQNYLDEIGNVYKNYVRITEKLFSEYETQFSERYTVFEGTLDDWDAKLLEAYNIFKSKMSVFQTESENEFYAWFNRIKGSLGSDPAGDLQNQVDELRAELADAQIMLVTGMVRVRLKTEMSDYITDNTGKLLLIGWPVCGCNK